MFKYTRIICICIIYVSSFYESMRENIVTAVPFEYANHDQLSTNMDDKQSMTKNNTRPISQETNKSKELSDLSERNEEEDLEPHERAASCLYGGAKYAHGQKLIRLDPCEVCLCMDGEIFCWWENCDKHPKRYTTVSSNNYMQKSEKTHKHPKSHKNKGKKKQIKATLGKDLVKLGKSRHELKSMNRHSIIQCKYFTEVEPEHNQKHRQHHKQHGQHHKYVQNHLATSPTFSKILNFPENLPSVLYHDYKSEEHQHHQYQHRQQHLKHQLVQLQMRHQQQKQQHQQQQQQQYLHEQHIKFEVTMLPSEHPSTENDNVDIETETDSDILPEPPTKRPKMTVTTIPATTATKSTTETIATKRTSNVHSTNESKNSDNMTAVKCTEEESGKTCRVAGSAFTPYTTATVVNATQSISRKPTSFLAEHSVKKTFKNAELYIDNKNENKQYDYLSSKNKNNNFINKGNDEVEDDAFHRWLSSNETHFINNNYDDFHNGNGVEKTVFDSKALKVLNNTNKVQEAPSTAIIVGTIPIRAAKKTDEDKESNKNILYTEVENGFLGTAYNDYGSEFNDSVINIDILLTEADDSRHVEQQRQQTQETPNYEDMQKEIIIVEADLILRPSVAETTSPVSIAIRAMPTSHNNSSPINLMSTTNEAPVIDTSNKLIADALNVVKKTAARTTLSPDKQCNVMGIFYQIGDILPQDAGNCLQCICTESSTGDDIPSVTCSPHNCPPLVLPDLFENTVY